MSPPQSGGLVVARAGFEPAISALRGRCPWPLDERAGCGRGAAGQVARPSAAAGLGLEPRLADPESAVLPLDDPASVTTMIPDRTEAGNQKNGARQGDDRARRGSDAGHQAVHAQAIVA